MDGIDLAGAAVLVAYAFLSNVAVAVVPHEPAVIVAGAELGVVQATLLATLGTAIAAWVDHRLFSRWLSARSAPTTGLVAAMTKRFDRAPFAVLALSGLLPLPMWPFKVLALSRDYRRASYVAALTVGRLPRYLALAAFGEALALPPALLIGVSAAFAVAFAAPALLSRGDSMKKHEETKATRITASLTSRWEKENLPRMARALPEWVTPDHLTGLGLVAAVVIGAGFALSTHHPAWLVAVIVGLFFHWVGDSLDGTLARVRNRTRERYGYYVDRTADAISTVLIGVGLGLSPYVRLEIAMMMTIGYLLLMMYAEICAYTSREFPLSFGRIGPTEVRIALAIFAAVLMVAPPAAIEIAGVSLTWVDGLVAFVSAGLLATFGASAWRQARKLDRLDRERWKLVTDSGTFDRFE